ncbi:GntR family transcriptional regulator [Actinocorallia longicatena]|uniref:GntR family transcriptional regulator n=1 Tax=Actinocorallia longicatena TaxID=111803 RepID=UPI0031D892AF
MSGHDESLDGPALGVHPRKVIEPEPFRHPQRRGSLVPELTVHLMREIARGVYLPGRPLPSVRELSKPHLGSVSDTVARKALTALVERGVAISKPGVGYFVKDGALAIINDILETQLEYSDAEPLGGPSTLARFPGGPAAPRTLQFVPIASDAATRLVLATLTVRSEMPSPDVAAALSLSDPRMSVIARHRLFQDPAGVPVCLRSSFLPASLAERTLLGSPQEVPGAWQDALSRCLMRPVGSHRTTILGRAAEEWEWLALMLTPHTMVIQRDTITYDATGMPLDFTKSTWPASGVRLYLEH